MNTLDKEKVLFFCCDIQDVFNNEANQKNYNCLQVIECACLMNEFAKVYDIPIIVSEQNPKVFGSTVQQLKNTFTQNTHFYEKFTFTMLSDKGLEILKQYPNRNQVVIYGLETHICVQQTCLDLIKLGYQVYVLTDGTSSSKPLFRSTAYERLKQCNVYLETSQSVMYTLMQTSQNEKFREVLKLVKILVLKHISKFMMNLLLYYKYHKLIMKIAQLLRNRVLFFNCDIQAVFNNPKHMYNPGQTIQCAQLMNEAAGILNIPVVYTEQNVKAFGSTIPEVKATIPPNSHYYEKHTFSMYNDDGKKVLSQYPDKNQVVIYGWEAHVCVQQTCLDLVRNGYQVHILTDGTSSNKPLYRSTSYQRLAQQGVVIDNSQSVLYELLQSYKDEKFKPILSLFKKYKYEEVFTTL